MRHNEPDCSDRSLRSGLLFGRVFKCLFKLFIGNIFSVCIFDELLELSRGHLSSLYWIHYLYGMSRRFLLRHDRSHSCDGQLLNGILFCCLRHGVFKLSRRLLPSNCGLLKL